MLFVKVSALVAFLPLAAAWPSVMEMNEKMQEPTDPPPRDPVSKSNRPNTGLPAHGFNATDQYVNVSSGSGHEWKEPKSGDLRGQCPGLNAAANHNFIPRNGILTIDQTINGLSKAYNMAPDLSLLLAVIAVALSGDPIKSTWSIGGAFSPTLPIYSATGILGTHNQYEGDASFVRGDAYLNKGKVGVFQMRSWNKMYERAESFTLDDAAAQSDYNTRWSILNNPYYFSAPFSALGVAAAHNFVINFMSNHSAENPGGFLSREVLKTFFAVTGDAPGNFVHTRGHERIPENWYKRPTANAYTLVQTAADVLINNRMYPGIIRIGGNTGKTDSFAGVDLADLTGGVFNLATLADGNNGACFLLQASLLGIPGILKPLLGAVGTLLDWTWRHLGPLNSELRCPELATFNNQLFNKFPGAKYKAEGQ